MLRFGTFRIGLPATVVEQLKPEGEKLRDEVTKNDRRRFTSEFDRLSINNDIGKFFRY